MTYSYPKLVELLARGGRLALATIVEAGGSTPQVPGASAIFTPAGLEAGTVGGGLLEARVEAAAKAALNDGRALVVDVRLDADPSDLEGAICGGTARVLIDPGVGATPAVYAAALDGFRRRRPGFVETRVTGAAGGPVTVGRRWLPSDEAAPAGGPPRLVPTAGGFLFLEPVRPLPRLVVAGAGHVGRAVARLGALLDFSVTVVDDRAEFANAANVPEADEIVAADIGGTLAALSPGPADYFVIVTRGHAKDGEALRTVIRREAAYVGMIGSRAKIGLMRREFLDRGWATEAEWARVHAPIGLDIGSKTVEEIAVSIAAELVRVRSGAASGATP